MPIRLWIDRKERIRRSRAFGVVTDRDFIDVYGGMARDPLCDPTLNHLADFSDVDGLQVTAAGLQETAHIMARRIDPGLTWADVRSKVAMIASSDAVFAMLRMYQSFREADEPRVTFLICRTMVEARSWLGLPAKREPAADDVVPVGGERHLS